MFWKKVNSDEFEKLSKRISELDAKIDAVKNDILSKDKEVMVLTDYVKQLKSRVRKAHMEGIMKEEDKQPPTDDRVGIDPTFVPPYGR